MPSPPRRSDEQLIGALIPTPLDRPQPTPAPLPALPARRTPGDGSLRLDTATVDPSGRICVRVLLEALGWQPRHPLALDVVDGIVVVQPAAAGRHLVGARGTFALPSAVRHMAGIDLGATVIVAADLAAQTLFVHPEAVVARILADLHARIEGARHGR
jgi:bifunctional DNA-binding transcriptional regulator/antitoxin component of YhaV-PrlF toxin-antitoxin module